MDMAVDQPRPSAFRSIWKGWRREILRGALLFSAVVGIGLAVRHVVPFVSAFPFDPDFNFDFAPGERQSGDAWEWRGAIKPSQLVWIRNTNGAVSVEAAPPPGNTLEVVAVKSWRRSAPEMVQLAAVPHEGGVTICALWDARESHCGSQGEYRQRGTRRNDVSVQFTVRLPRGVKVDASTVNGNVNVAGATAPVVVGTVNGQIEAVTSTGPVTASTVNGSIRVAMDALAPGEGDVELETVNGSVTATLPAGLGAELDAQTVNGRVATDFPLEVTGRINPRHIKATIGSGGRLLKLSTVNGSINIQRAASAIP